MTETEDHIPSRQFFFERNRPNELVVPACKRCNNITGPSEQVVSLLVRALREWTPRGLDHDRTKKMFDNFGVNNPEVMREWSKISLRQRRRCRKLREGMGRDFNPLNIGPYTRPHIYAFGAKTACALYYEELKRILPNTGGIYIEILTLDKFIRSGGLQPDLVSKLGTIQTLRQGKKDVVDQFWWASAHDEAGHMYFVDLSGSIALLLFVCDDVRDFETISAVGAHIHRPGDFLSYSARQDKSFGLSWTQTYTWKHL